MNGGHPNRVKGHHANGRGALDGATRLKFKRPGSPQTHVEVSTEESILADARASAYAVRRAQRTE